MHPGYCAVVHLFWRKVRQSALWLDPASRLLVTRKLIELFAGQERMSVLYVTHQEEEAIRLSDRIFEFQANGLVQSA